MSITQSEKDWVTVLVFLAALFGVIWGVQLNVAVMGITKEVATHKAEIDVLEDGMKSVAVTNARAAVVLQKVEENLDDLDDDFKEHVKDAEKWQREMLTGDKK